MKSYFRFIIIFLFTLGIFLLHIPKVLAGPEHNIRGRALTIGGAYEGNEYSLNFTSNTRVDIPFGNNYDVGSNSLTISMWVKPDTTSDSQIFASFGTNTDNRRAYFAKHNGKWDMGIRNSAWGSGQIDVTTNWTHISVVFNSDSNIATMYVNGNYNIQHSYTNYNLLDNFKIAVYGNNSYQFLGKIDNTRIYSRALSAEEIDRLYRGVEISDDGLVGNWMLNEGSGSTASDSSGNNNDGTLVNGPTWDSDTPEIKDRFVYFNCLDEPTGSFPYTFTFPLGGDPCEIIHTGLSGDIDNYGVDLDYSDYTFYGYVLHDQFGLISFRNGIPSGENYNFVDYCFKTNSDDCNSANNCSACYDPESQQVYGWAYVIADNDWIKLNSDEIGSIDRMRIFNYESAKAGDFYGFFYYDNWGEVDLNCIESGSGCSPNYKVYVGKVELAEMSAPYWGESKACSTTAKGAVLRWKVHGGQFNSYDIKINSVNDFDTAYEFSLAEGDPGFNKFQTTIGENGFNYDLDWDTSYYWWLKLNDDHLYNIETDWIQFDHGNNPINEVQGILTDNNTYNLANSSDPDLTFTTYKHEWPDPQFTWEGDPETSFQAGVANKFWVKDETKYYSSPGVSVNFTNPSFTGEFLWWGTIGGEETDKITIVDVVEFPDDKEAFFHLDASTILDLEHNDLIETWADISNNENDVTQNTENKRPSYHINALNGRPAVYFDGSSYLSNNDINIEQAFTVFVVAKSDTNIDNTYLLDSLNENNVSLGYNNNNKWLMFAGVSLTSSSNINDKLSIWRAYYNGEDSALNIIYQTEADPIDSEVIENGHEDFINNINGISIGASKNEDKHWQGYIAELIIYNVSLTSSEIKEIEDYLTIKWGIDEKDEATASSVYVYFESIEDNQRIWLSLTDPTGYTCSISTDSLSVNYELPLWREVRARE